MKIWFGIDKPSRGVVYGLESSHWALLTITRAKGVFVLTLFGIKAFMTW